MELVILLTRTLFYISLPILLLLFLHRTFGPIFRKKEETEETRTREPDRVMDQPSFKWPAADMEMGALEPIVVHYPIGPLPLLFILDGQVLDDNLAKVGQTRFWLKNEVQRFGVRRFKEVAYCSMDNNGRFFLDKKTN